ncbi:MAG: EamA family transporter [Clostridiales bacterium]|nr:EamA family transporter [Clostridiales bacterium]
MWFVFTLIATLCWGAADLYYKKGADKGDRYSHLKTGIMVGLVMGAHALVMLCVNGFDYDFRNLYIYLPVSLMYILSMTVGYFGLRYLLLSLSSPIQNTSGAVVFLLCVIFLGQRPDLPSTLAVVLITAGVLLLGVLEYKAQARPTLAEDRKYRVGFWALLIPVVYCVIDALGTFFDAYYLDSVAESPLLGVTAENIEFVANTSYELTFLIGALALIVFLLIRKEPMPVRKQGNRGVAALFETGGQVFYVYAMAANAVVAAPVVAAYCMVSVLLSRLFLKEKLTRWQYVSVGIVIAGIVFLGVLEGLSNK